MEGEFAKAFHQEVLPAVIACLDDQVDRVQSHACAGLTNFCEHASVQMLLPHVQILSTKFCTLINEGISMTKENASTALGTVVDRIGGEFTPHF